MSSSRGWWILTGGVLIAAGCRRDTMETVQDQPRPPADAARPQAETRPVAPALAPAPSRAPAPVGSRRVTVVYTTDVHGQFDRWGRPGHALGGFARRAALIARLRKESPALVQVDAGDAVSPPAGWLAYLDGDPAERVRRADFVLGAYARLGVQAIAPGTADLALGARKLAERARAAHVPYVCANLADEGGRPVFERERLVEARGISVGVFGIVDLPPAEGDRLRAEGVTVSDPLAAARAAVASLRGRGARVVVALLHAKDAAAGTRLGTAVKGIDLVVRSGQGNEQAPSDTGQPPVVHAGLDGKRVGQIDLYVAGDDVVGAGVQPGESRLHDLGHTLAEDRTLAKMSERYSRDLQARAMRGSLSTMSPRLANAYAVGREKDGKPPFIETWAFGSSAGCALCHTPQTAQWKTTSHAFALESLISKGHDKDPECLSCHTTAFLRPGGTRSLLTATIYFPAVGCESCHGPSVEHVRSRKKTTTRRFVPEATCRECHADERSAETFNFAEDLKAVLGPGHGVN